jgi:hypothetical protein
MPDLVLWSLRISLCLTAYMYHGFLGLVHLSWVLASFVTQAVSSKVTLYMTIVTILPIYTWEFFILFCAQMQSVNEFAYI